MEVQSPGLGSVSQQLRQKGLTCCRSTGNLLARPPDGNVLGDKNLQSDLPDGVPGDCLKRGEFTIARSP